VCSAMGTGSTFTLYLPAAWRGPGDAFAPDQAVDNAAAVAVAAVQQRSAAELPPGSRAPIRPVLRAGTHDSLRDRRVLIVDDDPRNVFALTGVLELYGMTVIHAGNGEHGIEALKR